MKQPELTYAWAAQRAGRFCRAGAVRGDAPASEPQS